MKILSNIPNMDDNALARLMNNARAMLVKSPENQDAAKVIEYIEVEWQKRLHLFQSGKYKASTPENGVLSIVGYKVGNDGGKLRARRQILDYIMSGTLPPVGSPAYIAEWGEPLTRKRYVKLHRVIRVLASSGQTLGTMEKAVSDWEDDLLYLEQEWAPRFH